MNPKIEILRSWMRENGFDACVVPQTDPHLSEYVEKYDEIRTYFSGFTGSAGTLLVTMQEAGLWTDSRYYIQAEQQLFGSGITLYKDGLPTTPVMRLWLQEKVGTRGKVAANAMCFSKNEWQQWQEVVDVVHEIGFEACWRDRPALSTCPCFLFPEKYAGKTASQKIAEFRQAMLEKGVGACFLSALDDIAWLLNVRGNDVEYVPVVRSYLWIDQQQLVWWVSLEKVKDALLLRYLADLGIQIAPYDDVEKDVLLYNRAHAVWVDASLLNARLYQLMSQTYRLVDAPLWTSVAKSMKNEVELQGIRRAMCLDGVAWVRSLMWLQEQLPFSPTELDFRDAMEDFKKQSSLYMSESFAPIVGYAANAAIVHYEPTVATNKKIASQGFLLVDAGSHYWCGTTDATRTIACGPLSRQQCECYTWVLKGMIALASAKFDAATAGSELDVMARRYLKMNGKDYGHGTGHGIGHVLSVHERGATISPRATKPLRQGMVLSDEPGYYQTGDYGIRIENVITVGVSEGGKFSFSVLTLIPLEMQAICVDLLSEKEKQWINNYHHRVRESLRPMLSNKENEWLKLHTYEI